MANQLPIIARTNKSGLDLLTVHKSQTLVLPDDGSAADCDVSLTLHGEAQEIIDSLIGAVEHCKQLIIRYEINAVDHMELEDKALKIIQSALAKARGEEV
ncbi:hypothetical protein [Brucella anthropi]|uniref:hypothetical protein n=1 Tax=Brucella anthropi TaxID=529 RepID=UPI00124CFCA2|nr:hypothetical protein [Brucella anthropi]KAB2728230.1 hypothetical protein F9K76_01915 [Brucella anthropi]KAB2745402.1 hypothetical protein F9K74_01865 [Brucella anthropi]KAB2805826.1 hypothetical protein F9K83_01865 [Brucella anthropi]